MKVLDRIFRHEKLIVAIVAVITVFFALQLLKLKIDNDVMNFIPPTEPAIQAYLQLDELYGGQFLTSVGVKNPYGTIADKEFIDLVRQVSTEISAMDYVLSVTSITNTPETYMVDGAMNVGWLVPEDYTGTPAEKKLFKERLYSWELYKQLYSDDFRSTQIVLTLDMHLNSAKPAESSAVNNTEISQIVYNQLKKIVQPLTAAGYEVYIAGYPVLMGLTTENIQHDLTFLLPLVIAVLIATLVFTFRRPSGVFLPLLTVVISIIWTVGLMSMLGLSLNILATIIPVILVAVGSAYGIHLINKYYDACQSYQMSGSVVTKEDHRDLVVSTLRSIRAPIILAGLTTMAGFASLAFTNIIPVRYFGIFSSIGVAVALLVTYFLIPSILIIRGPSRMGLVRHSSILETDALRMFRFFALNKKITFILVALLFIVSVVGVRKIVVENVLVDYYKETTAIVKAERFLGREFGGTNTFSVSIEGTEPGAIANPDVLSMLEDLQIYLKQEYPQITSITGFPQFIKRANQLVNWYTPPSTEDLTSGQFASLYTASYAGEINHPTSASDSLRILQRSVNYHGVDYYEIPLDMQKYGVSSKEDLQSLVMGYLMVMGEGTAGWVDDPFLMTKGRILIQMKSGGSKLVADIMHSIDKFTAKRLPEGYKILIAGPVVTEHAVTSSVVNAQVLSIVLSAIMVVIILVFYFKSFFFGLISIIPILLSIMINFGVMGFFHIKLDIATAMVASIAIGIGIDYVIHFLDSYRRYYREYNNHTQSVVSAINTSGKAIIFNAMAVFFGFVVLALSSFRPLMYLGILIALTMVTASVGALTALPILLGLREKFFKKKV